MGQRKWEAAQDGSYGAVLRNAGDRIDNVSPASKGLVPAYSRFHGAG